jgi:crotonobetainyl-CoA:carnitine CoA-transferase CaiB-like acyl-CoA transferase
MRDLEGLLVVSVEQAVAAPYASSRLADAGARVIKVERPEGDFARNYDRLVEGESAYFVWLNRGKESVRLDLKDPADHAVLGAMLEEADVFIQNLAPGAMERLGFGARALRERRPELITCSISGYGETGPRRDQKAYDLLIQAETGLAGITGTPEGAARVGVSVCDISAGMTACSAILRALIGRGRTGEGRAIEVSLFHATADWMNVPYLQARYGGRPPKREGLRHPTIAPYGVFEAADGAILISIQNEREWKALCEQVLEDAGMASDPRFADNSARVENRAALDARVGESFARHGREDLAARLDAARIAYGRLSDMQDLIEHPQQRLVTVRTDAGEIEIIAPGAALNGETETPGAVPGLGRDDAKIRAEFGGR